MDNIERLRELARKVEDVEGRLSELVPDERHELERLLRERVGEEEFGYLICGED